MKKELTEEQKKEIEAVGFAFGKKSEVISVSPEDIIAIKTWLPYYEAQIGPLEGIE